LKKRIPLGGGLAGGSTDAATTLRGLNTLWGLGLDRTELLELAARLGSDVPFCLESGWAIATGRGEKLEPLSQRRRLWVVLANPGFEVSTKWAYGAVRSTRKAIPNLSRRAYRAIQARDVAKLERYGVNDLEPVTAGQHKEINRLKTLMTENGAQWTRMSGSGPTVMGLFENEAKAKNAYKFMKKKAKVAVCVSTISRIPKR
jgi:4-diphosphocytidyl-2-C-methyl-D-erythritol kinase